MSQKTQILEHLKKGFTITPYEALNMCGCFRLGGAIMKLRNEGHNITTTMIENNNGNRFARYELEAE